MTGGHQPEPGNVDKLTGARTRSPWTPGRDEWAIELGHVPAYRLEQLWLGLHDQGLPPDDITTLPKALRSELGRRFQPALRLMTEQRTSDGATVKWLWETTDGARIETVLMHYDRRSTVCISSQAGCAMDCGFCATGQAGFKRHLSVGEILEQVVAARRRCQDDTETPTAGRRLSNVVFMGMGEPFANYDRVIEATRRMVDDFGIGARHITISTVGLVPQMRRFADEGMQVGLALSLHAANDALRNELVPLNRRHPIAELVAACRHFRERTGRRVSIEWAMIDGVNDTDGDADELVAVATDARAHVNLIPLNPTPGWPTVGSPADRIERFANRLRTAGVNVTVRRNRGTDIDAACGQLAGSDGRPGRAVTESGQAPVQLRPRR